MITLSNRETVSVIYVRNWGPGFSNLTAKQGTSRTLSITPGALIKGDHKKPNAWSFTIVDRKIGEKNFWQTFQYPYGTSQSGAGAGGYPSAALPTLTASDPYNAALGKVYDGIRGGLDLSIDLAEVHQTTKMISGLAGQVVDIATHLTSVGGISKTLANTWLQWQYGVRPAMQTIHDLVDHQIDFTCAPKVITKRASRAAERSTATSPITNCPGKDIEKAESRIELSLSFSVSNAERYALSTYGSLNPVSLLWELTPYSFVADWFVDVGGYLRMAETALIAGMACQGGYKSVGTKSSRTTYAKGSSNARESWDCTASTEVKTFNRSILPATMPMPNLPSLDVHLGSQRLMSAAALLRQILQRV